MIITEADSLSAGVWVVCLQFKCSPVCPYLKGDRTTAASRPNEWTARRVETARLEFACYFNWMNSEQSSVAYLFMNVAMKTAFLGSGRDTLLGSVVVVMVGFVTKRTPYSRITDAYGQ